MPTSLKKRQFPIGVILVQNVILNNHYFCDVSKGKWIFNIIACILVISNQV